MAAAISEAIPLAESAVSAASSSASSASSEALSSQAGPSSSTPASSSNYTPSFPVELSSLPDMSKPPPPVTSPSSEPTQVGSNTPSSSSGLPLFLQESKGTTVTPPDLSKPSDTRGTSFGESRSYPGFTSSGSLMSGIRDHFNATASSSSQANSNKPFSTSSLLSNMLFGPRLTLNPTINVGNSNSNQRPVSSAGSIISTQ